jgi:hypothetical protein
MGDSLLITDDRKDDVRLATNFVASDGADLWAKGLQSDGTLTRVRASDRTVLGMWTGAASAVAVLVAGGLIYIKVVTNHGSLNVINPSNRRKSSPP